MKKKAFAKGIETLVCYISFSQMRLLEECRGSIDTVKRVGFELKEEDDKSSGFVNPNSSESQTSGTKPYNILCHAHEYILIVIIKMNADSIY